MCKTRRRIDVLGPSEVVNLQLQCNSGKLTGVRNRALIALLYGAGLRIAEALALLPRDLDLVSGTVTVQHGKGGQRRVSGVVPDATPTLRDWATRRATLALGADAPFLCTHTRGRVRGRDTRPGLPLRPEYVRVMLKRLARAAGLEKRVHPHGFRHSHAFLLRERGWDVEAIRKQLGHSSLLVTSVYLDHLGATDLARKMRGFGAVFSSAE